ncbi:MAG TPA: photosynthetic reaction center cytochrome c subunit family protein [Mucilaginibacter sp.]|nr:photosynthetic reaction center cytochrome c subunit family protein [Mucilaginibacter sp.]
MKRPLIITTLLAAICLLFSFTEAHKNYRNNLYAVDSLSGQRKQLVDSILNSLPGKANSAADSVFSNIRTFTGNQRLPVKHLLAVMDYWGEALGVGCYHCHAKTSWSSDDLANKRIARQMYNMRDVINTQILGKMTDVDPKIARVNCTTCHNGNTVPLHH